MAKYYILGLLLTLACSLSAVILYSPLCSSPCQLTKGPGSYGKSCSDVRYRAGWEWMPVSCE